MSKSLNFRVFFKVTFTVVMNEIMTGKTPVQYKGMVPLTPHEGKIG